MASELMDVDPPAPSTQPRQQLQELACIVPSPATRTWQTVPHPLLPIVAVACADKTARIFSLSTFEQVGTVSGGHKRSVRSVAWKPGSGPRGVKKEVGVKRRPRGAREGASSAGKNLGGGDEDAQDGVRTESGRGESVLVTGSFDASAGIWRRWERQSGLVKDDSDEHGGETQEMDFTRDPDEDDDNNNDADDGEEWQFAVVLDGHDSEIKSVGYSGVAPFLATCSRDKSVWIWEELEDDNYETVAVLQEHEGDVKCIAWHPSEVLVASGSYDDTVRLWREEGEGEDWACCCVLDGFGATVWSVAFEPAENVGVVDDDHEAEGDAELRQQREEVLAQRVLAGPRLLTAADDGAVRVFRRNPKAPKAEQPQWTKSKVPSILKTGSIAEEWIEEGTLGGGHDRAVYAVSWSGASGRVASCGSDGRVVVYEESWVAGQAATQWAVVAEVDDAHGVFEVNHVTFAPRADKGGGGSGGEVVVSTGDGGDVKVWALDV